MGLEPFAVSLSPRRLDEVLHSDAGRNAIFQLSLADGDKGQSRAAMIRELVRHPVNSAVLHVDFVRVDLTKKVQVSVPVHVVGEAAGVKTQGGILEIVHREVQVECLPGNIPEQLDIDVTALEIGGQVHVREIQVDADVALLDDPEQVVLHVVAPTVVEEEVAKEEEGAEAEAGEGTEGESAEGGESSGDKESSES
jgi:large subunit ribosomal protein L25